MAEHAKENTLETTIANLPDEREDGTDTADSAYTPVFSKQVRTVVYVLGLIASCVGLGFMTFGDAAVGGYISTVALSADAGGGAFSCFQRVLASCWNPVSSSSGYLNLASMPCASRIAAISLLRALTMA